MSGKEWTEDMDETLRRLDRQGSSASHIAKAIGHGKTRNAVIGRIHRLGLRENRAPRKFGRKPPTKKKAPAKKQHRRGSGGRNTREQRIAAMRKKHSLPTVQVHETAEALASLRLSVLDLTEQTCKFPTGGENEHTEFCGHRSQAGVVYCKWHANIAYTPVEYRRRRRKTRNNYRMLGEMA